MSLLKTTTPVEIIYKTDGVNDEWGVPTYEEQGFTAKARMKVTEIGAGNPSLESLDNQEPTRQVELTFNKLVKVSVGNKVKFTDDHGNPIESVVSKVGFIKDFAGKVLLTKVEAQ